MRKGLVGSILALAAAAGMANAQPPGPGPGPMVNPLMGGDPFGGAGIPPGPAGALFGQPGADPLGPGPNAEAGYLQFDALLSTFRTMKSNYPLITVGTTTVGGTHPNLGTTSLFGAENFNFNPFMGGRFNHGMWFQRNPEWGFEWGGFVTEQRQEQFVLGVGDQVLARPFINADSGLPDSFVIAFPGFARGGVTSTLNSQLWGLEWNLQRKLFTDATKSFTFNFGLRYLDLEEDLSVASQTFFLPGAHTFFYGTEFGPPTLIPTPNRVDVQDSFGTRNQYIVAQFGMSGEWRYNRWVVQWCTKLGLGDVRQTLDITGSSSIQLTAGAAFDEVPGGVLAVSSNIGRYHSDQFVVIPEGRIQVGYRFFSNVDLVVGYNFMFMSRAARPADQIDPTINTANIPTGEFYSFPAGPGRPLAAINQTDIWMQSLNFGFSIHY